MTVPSETRQSGPYSGNDVTTVFAYGFRIFDAAHLVVTETDGDGVEAVLTLDVDYTVTGVGDANGTIVLSPALPTGHSLLIERVVELTQEIDLENQGPYYAETVERGFDLSVMRDQQLNDRLSVVEVFQSDVDDAIAAAAAAEASADAAEISAADALEAQLAAEAAAILAGGVAAVADRAAMRALDYSHKKAARIYDEGGRNGPFAWRSGNYDALVTADPLEGIYVASGNANMLGSDHSNFDAVAWGKTGVTVTANAALSPFGTMEADQLIESTANSGHILTIPARSFTAGLTYTTSVYAELAVGTRNVRVSFPGTLFDAAGRTAYFDLVAGAVASQHAGLTSAAIEDLGGGQFRLSITAPCVSSGSGSGFVGVVSGVSTDTYVGDGASGVYLFGAKIEVGPVATALGGYPGAWVRQGDWAISGVDIRCFGGVPDADTTTGIGTDNLAPLNAAAAIPGVTQINFGPGNWYFSGSINLPKYKGVWGVGHVIDSLNANVLSTNRGTIFITDMAAGTLDGNGRPQTEFIRCNKGNFFGKFGGIWVGHDAPSTTSWAPEDTPWFFRCGRFTDTSFTGDRATGIRVDDVRGYGFTHGWEFQRGADAESYINFIGGHFFKVGFSADGIHDVFRITGGVHLWRQWSAHANVSTYMWENYRAYEIGRIDGLKVDGGLFSLGARESCVFIGSRSHDFPTQFAAAFDIDKLYCDSSGVGLIVEVGHTGVPLTGKIGYLAVSRTSTAISSLAAADDLGVDIPGYAQIKIDHAWLTGAGYSRPGGHVRLAGTRPSQVRFGSCQYSSWDNATAGKPAFEVTNSHLGGILTFEDVPYHDQLVAVPAAALYSGLKIDVDAWRAFTPTVTALVGTITTVGALDCYYKRIGKTVELDYAITITTNGTGATALAATTPFRGQRAVVAGFGANLQTGNMLRGRINTSVARVDMQLYNASYPVSGDGQTVNLRASYELQLV